MCAHARENNTQGLADRQALQAVLEDPSNRYLARQLCWVYVIESLETYILVPRDRADLDLLIEAVRSDPTRDDVDVVIGTRGPLAPPTAGDSKECSCCPGAGSPDTWLVIAAIMPWRPDGASRALSSTRLGGSSRGSQHRQWRRSWPKFSAAPATGVTPPARITALQPAPT